jgi:hypothetical protein
MTTQSETMMNLLKELALLKELDGTSEALKSQDEESEARRTRRQEITDQIKALGETAS